MPKQTKALEALERTREQTLADVARLKEQLQEEIEPASATDDDSADVAADIYERGKIISLIQNLDLKLHSVERAMELANEGKYGICEKCGAVIPEERLHIMPETTLCVRCASEREKGIRRSQLNAAYRTTRRPRVADEDEEEDEPESDDDSE
jgi:RNA polymerase-binding transcription factor DksA